MAWNGSDQTSRRGDIPAAPKGEATSKSLLRSSPGKPHKTSNGAPLLRSSFFLLPLLLALAGAAVWYFFLRPAPPPGRVALPRDRKSSAIASHTNTVARPRRVEQKKVEAPKVESPNEPKLKTYIDSRGIKRYEGGARVRDPNAKTDVVRLDCDSDGNPLYKKALFKHRCENEIACLITLEPGSTLIGTPNYGDRFKQDFVEALLVKNEPTGEDSPRDAELKRQVDEIKASLADRVKNGEDLGEIFLETRREMQKLALIKRDIRTEALKMARDSNNSADDAALAVAAANRLLEAKGIAPLHESDFFDGAMKVEAADTNE